MKKETCLIRLNSIARQLYGFFLIESHITTRTYTAKPKISDKKEPKSKKILLRCFTTIENKLYRNKMITNQKNV